MPDRSQQFNIMLRTIRRFHHDKTNAADRNMRFGDIIAGRTGARRQCGGLVWRVKRETAFRKSRLSGARRFSSEEIR